MNKWWQEFLEDRRKLRKQLGLDQPKLPLKKRLHHYIAIAAGISVFVLLCGIGITLLDGIGAHPINSPDDEENSGLNFPAYAVVGLSILIGFRVFESIEQKKIRNVFNPDSEIDFRAWVYGLGLFALVAGVWTSFFDIEILWQNVTSIFGQIIILLVVGVKLSKWVQKEKSALSKSKSHGDQDVSGREVE